VLIVILLVGFGVILARRPGKEIDEWGNATTPSDPPGGPTVAARS